MRPGEPLEIPSSRFAQLCGSRPGNVSRPVKRLKITTGKSDGGNWSSFFDPFYNEKTVICEYDRPQRLIKAVMLDGSGEICILNSNSFDENGRLAAETSEVYDRVYGRDGSGSAQDMTPRTGELVFFRTVKNVYSPAGLLTRSDYKNRNKEGHFDYSYDSSENLVKISCYIKGEKKPYYRFEYFYNEKGNISRMDWFNWNGELEMYYEYFYDGRGNCVKVKCPPYLLADRETAILENTFKYDDFNRVTDIVYFNWLKVDNSRPDSLIRCVYGEAGLLKEIEIEPALLNPGKKYSFKYSYDFF